MSAELEWIEDLTTSPPSVFCRPADAQVAVGWRASGSEAATINYRRLLGLLFGPEYAEDPPASGSPSEGEIPDGTAKYHAPS